MPSLDRPSKQSHGTHRLEIVTIMLVQVLIMVVVLIAALYYINWSSDAALAEFNATSNQSPQPPKLTQSVKSRKKCFSKT
jgi:hypothetical protein